MGISDFLSEGWDGIKEFPSQAWEGIRSVPEALKGFNIVHLLIAFVITIFVGGMFWMPEIMGMQGWPLYIKIVVPAITLVVSYIVIQIKSD